jgi:hypothetical protein
VFGASEKKYVGGIALAFDRFAQSDERGDGWSADGERLDRARKHRGSNAGFLLGHHPGSGPPRQSDGSVAAVRPDDVAGDVWIDRTRDTASPAISSDDRVGETTRFTEMVCSASTLLATGGTQSAPTNDSFPRIPPDAVPGSMTALGHGPAFCEHKGTIAEGPRAADRLCKNLDIPVEACGARMPEVCRRR